MLAGCSKCCDGLSVRAAVVLGAFYLLFLEGTFKDLYAGKNHEAWVQQWGLSSATQPIDYDAGHRHLLARHHKVVVLWDANRGLALRRFPSSGAVKTLRFYGDDAVLIENGKAVLIFDKQSGKLLREIQLGDSGSIHFLMFRDDEPVLVASCGREEIHVWDLESGETLQTFPAEGKVSAATVTPDQQYLLTGSEDGVGILWNLEDGTVHQRFRSPVGISKVVFSPDGRKCLTIGSGEFWYTPRVVVWDVATGVPLLAIPRTVRDADFTESGIRLIDPNGVEELWAFDRHEQAPAKEEWETFQQSPDDRVLFTPDQWLLRINEEARTVSLIESGSTGQTLEVPSETAFFDADHHSPIAFSKTGRWLLSGGSTWGRRGNLGALWDLEKGEMKLGFKNIFVGAFDSNEKQVAVSTRRELKLFSLDTGDVLQTFRVQPDQPYSNGEITSAQFTHDGKQLLISLGDWYDGDGGGILLWDCESGEVIRNYSSSSKAVISAGFGVDEKQIIAALSPGNDGSAGVNELSLIDVESGESLKSKTFPDWGIGVGQIDPTGRLIPVISYDSGSIYRHRSPLASLLQTGDLEPVHEDFRGQQISWDFTGETLASHVQKGVLEFRTARSGETLLKRPTSLSADNSTLLQPAGMLIAGSLRDPRRPGKVSSYAVGVEDILTGEVQAEFYLFPGEDDWLIKTESGVVNGSNAGLGRVTQRTIGTLQVEPDRKWTGEIVDATAVGKVLTKPLPEGTTLSEELQKAPKFELPSEELRRNDQEPWYDHSMQRRIEIAKKLEAAGAEVKVDIHKAIHYVHLEKKSVTSELLNELRWAGRIDRLYLAKTGITDGQLDFVGLQIHVKRLSLWGNPITDKGIVELTSMWSLEVLDIHDTKVTANGLMALSELPNLKMLIIPKGINPVDLLPLRAKHPALEIVPR